MPYAEDVLLGEIGALIEESGVSEAVTGGWTEKEQETANGR